MSNRIQRQQLSNNQLLGGESDGRRPDLEAIRVVGTENPF